MKKIGSFACLLVIVLLFSCLASADENGTLTLPSSLRVVGEEAFSGAESLDKVIVPEGVTTIQSRAFADTEVKEFDLPDTLKTIGDEAFAGNESLERLEIPEGVTSIGNGAFADTGLQEISLPESLENIPEDLFGSNTEVRVLVPEGSEAEAWCQEHDVICSNDEGETFLLASGVTGDGAEWFLYDNGEVVLQGSGKLNDVTGCGFWSKAKKNGVSVRKLTIGNGITGIVGYFCSGKPSVREISIPDSVTKLESGAFSGIKNLTTVRLPEGLVSPLEYPTYFSGTKWLTEWAAANALPDGGELTIGTHWIAVPDMKEYRFRVPTGWTGELSVVCEGEYAASYYVQIYDRNLRALRMESVYLNDHNNYTFCLTDPEEIANCAYIGFFNHANYEVSVSVIRAVVSEREWTSITENGLVYYPMSDNSLILTDVDRVPENGILEIPSSVNGIPVTTIGSCAISRDGIRQVIVPDSVTVIREYAFELCRNLESITLPSSVQTIGHGAFSDCLNLVTVNAPDSLLARIDQDDCLSETPWYRALYDPEVELVNGENSLSIRNESKDYLFTVPEDGNYTFRITGTDHTSLEIRDAQGGFLSEIWFGSDEDDPDNTATVERLLQGTVLKVSLSNSDYYQKHEYYQRNPYTCTLEISHTPLTDVVVENGVYYGSWDDDQMQVIGAAGDPTQVTVSGTVNGKTVTRIGKDAFRNKASLESVVIPDSVVDIDLNAFAGCAALRTIEMPEALLNSEGILDVFRDTPWIRARLGDRLTDGDTVTCEDSSTSVTVRVSKFDEYSAKAILNFTVDQSGEYRLFCEAVSGEPDLELELYWENLRIAQNGQTADLEKGTTYQVSIWAYDIEHGIDVNLSVERVSDEEIFNHIIYRLTDDNTYAAVGPDSTMDFTNLVLVSEINGIPVTAFTSDYFLNAYYVRSVTIPDSIVTIPYGFTGCSGLRTVNASEAWIETYAETGIFDGTPWMISRKGWLQSGDRITSGVQYLMIRNGNDNLFELPQVSERGLVHLLITSTEEHVSVLFRDENGQSVNPSDSYTDYDSLDIYLRMAPGETRTMGLTLSYYNSKIITVRYSVEPDSDDRVEKNGVLYQLRDDDHYRAVGMTETGTELILPAEVDGIPVTEIGPDAFAGNTAITRAVIPDSVQTVGDGAFRGCSALETVVMPDGLVSILEYDKVFGGTPWLTHWIEENTLRNGDTLHPGDNCFVIGRNETVTLNVPMTENADAELTINLTAEAGKGKDIALVYDGHDGEQSGGTFDDGSIQFTFTAEEIAGGSFSFTYEPSDDSESVTVVAGYRLIPWRSQTVGGIHYRTNDSGELTVTGCDDGVTDVTIPAVVEGMPVVEIDKYAFKDSDTLRSMVLPSSVTEIGEGAFTGCYNLQSVVLPENLDSFNYFLFQYCGSLTSVTIPDSVNSIGYGAFKDCTGLTEVNCREELLEDTDLDNCFQNTPWLLRRYGVVVPGEALTVGDNRLLISNSSYYSYSFTTPEDGRYSFWVDDEELDGSVLVISSHDEKLMESWMPQSEYGENSVLLPAGSVCTVKVNLYSYYVDQKYETLTITLEPYDNFIRKDGLIYQKMSDGTLDVYDADTELTSVVIPESIDGYPVTAIRGYAFADHTNLRSVVIPSSVSSILSYAFQNCTGLEYAEIGGDSIAYSYTPFRGCTALTNVVFSGDYNVDMNTYLEFADTPWAVDQLDALVSWDALAPDQGRKFHMSSAWGDNSGITLCLEPTVTGLYHIRLSDMLSWFDVTLFNADGERVFHEKAQSEGDLSFAFEAGGTYGLEIVSDSRQSFFGDIRITVETDLIAENGILYRETENNTLEVTGCVDGLTDPVIVSQVSGVPVTAIAAGAFKQDLKLQSVTIPDSVTSIGDDAFLGCSNLEDVWAPDALLEATDLYSAFCLTPWHVTRAGALEDGDPLEDGPQYILLNEECYYTANMTYQADSDCLLTCAVINPRLYISGTIVFDDERGEDDTDNREFRVTDGETIRFKFVLYSYSEDQSVYAMVRINTRPDPTVVEDHVRYEPREDDTWIATGLADSEWDGSITIPAQINGKTVSAISENAFSNTNLYEVTIESESLVIESYAFAWCWDLRIVNIPDALNAQTEMIQSAFLDTPWISTAHPEYFQ